MGRGARVSPGRFPMTLSRTGRAAFTASGSPQVPLGGWCWFVPWSRDLGAAIAIALDRHRGGLVEPDSVVFRFPPVVVAVDDPPFTGSGVFVLQPFPDSPPQVVL